ncbi:phage head morphogenesis protein [Apilactobacillus micheneri]|uniref:minor capsid protein n=1 Tax=Apilactobacillus micheneri TaxID=1899430 RepID=UPI0011264C05|nr:minor capsid protein [Apilactobacillus micheneri]TPR48187.1 phage head morphogenesis protein [Apilactobacillus micheneri]
MKNEKYWLRRFIQEKALSIKSGQEYEIALNKRLDQLLAIYEQDIKQWYKRFSDELGIPRDETVKMLDGIELKHFEMTLAQFKEKAIKGGYDKQLDSEYFKSQIARLKQLESQFKAEAKDLFSVEQLKMEDELVNQFNNTYLHDSYNIQDYRGHFEVTFATLNTDKLRHIIANPWAKNNENFSQRIWGNYVEELPSQLMDSMLRQTLTGSSYQDIEREFRQRFSDVKSKHIHRLVVSELGHAQEEGSALAYKNQSVEKYQYLATFERSTCDECAHMDGKVFKLSERQPGLNYPLLHAYCRCTTIPYLEESPGEEKRWADGKIIDDMTFDEWLNKAA